MRIDFNIETRNFKELGATDAIIKRAANLAMSRALDSMKTQLSRETTTRYFVTSSEIKKTLTARLSTVAGFKQGVIISRAPRLSLTAFKVNPKSPSYKMKGRRYQAAVKREGGIKTLSANSFYIPKRKKMYRRIQAGGRGFQNLRMLQGPAIPQMLKNEQTKDAITQKTKEVFEYRLSHEIKRLLLA